MSWVAENLTPIIAYLLHVLGTVGTYMASGFVNSLKLGIGIIKSITGFIKGLVETTANVVDAFTNMKNGIVGAFESIPNAIKSAINAAIGFINSMINSFNSLKIEVPNPFGENYKYSPTIPNIPQLANGGYVKAGRGGVLAQIGEGRYNEIVKNDKQRQIDNNYVLDGVEKLIDSKLSNMGTLQPVIIQVGDTELATVLIDVLRGEVKRTGKSILA
jgi:hypothetical protein